MNDETPPVLMRQEPWIAYVGPFLFPTGEAASLRVRGVALAIASGGRDVAIASGSQHPEHQIQARAAGGVVTHVGLGERPVAGDAGWRKAVQVYVKWGERTVAWLESQQVRPSHVILYGGFYPYARRILSWCRARGVKLVIDQVEWYSPRQLRGGLFGPDYWSFELAHRHVYGKVDGVIAISSLIAEHYRHRGVKTTVVPPLFDTHGRPPHEPVSSPAGLRLVYFGTAGRKDLLKTIVDGFALAGVPGSTLKIAGVSAAEVGTFNMRSIINVEVMGRVPQEEIGRLLQNEADFSVLLRPPSRYADAGFPTKIVESLVNGLPVICNITSDLARHVLDGKNGLVVDGWDANAFGATLTRAWASQAQWRDYRHQAFAMAEEDFDYRRHAAPLNRFLDCL